MAFTVHMSLLGETGFKQLARLNHAKAADLADALSKVNGISIENETYFNEFVISLPKPSDQIVSKLAEQGIIAGYAIDEKRLLVCATEMTTDDDIKQFVKALEGAL